MARSHQARNYTSSRHCRSSRRARRAKVFLKMFSPKVDASDQHRWISSFRDNEERQWERRRNAKKRSETTQLIDKDDDNDDFLKKRWVALGLFCALICSQCCVWNTWGPIAASVMLAFPGWNKSLVALLSSWGCITYLTCCLLCCWLLHNKGLPMPLRIAAILSTLATFLRCVSSQEKIFTIMAHTAAILNGLSGVIVGPATALVSATWFPQGERTTATGISSACNQLGMALSYLIGPAVVRSPYINSSKIYETYSNEVAKHYSLSSVKSQTYGDVDPEATLRIQIMSLMRIEFVGQSLVLVGVLLFYPEHPCQSIDTAEVSSRLGLMESILRLLKNKNMWQLCLAAALSQGTSGPWLAMITMTFGTTVTQEEADKLAFWTIVFGSFLSLTASRLTDVFQNHLKIAIYILLTTSSVMFLWILLLDNRVLVFHKEELYAAIILGISASWSTPALFLELASEIAFPVSEAIVGGYLIFLANLIGMLFYFSYFIPGMGERWSNYCIFANQTVATALVIRVTEEYNRTNSECLQRFSTKILKTG